VEIGSIVLRTPFIGWPQRLLGRHRIECEAAAAAPKPSLADGARVEDGTIRLHVERARAGEDEALAELFQEFRPTVLRLCTRMLGPVDAEDGAHETFQRAQRQLDRYDIDQPFQNWLLSIASHHCIDRLRRRSLEKRLFEPTEPEVEELVERRHSALDELVQRRRQTAVRDAIDRLPDQHRAPLVLRYFADLDYDAIGEELGLTRSQVATSLFRAKQRLRDLLRSEQETDS
jgi:RNA polymerase sigma-70 factor (ECF subfamily)